MHCCCCCSQAAGWIGVMTMGMVPADGSSGNASALKSGVFVGVAYTPPTAAQRAAGRYNLTTVVGPSSGDGQLGMETPRLVPFS
jgi:hypothetical protein